MPFDEQDVRYDLTCGVGPDARWFCSRAVSVRAGALRRLGLHPDQPTSAAADPPPAWWDSWDR
ncbi:hypothetical protein ACIRBX_16210 [Kitasatospora sp. NPDC096147]|uniref:hypothetical protein n=1 Tax=Kitasatospora sp. NPDC096147 TaxID=3364093 RepID=UPI003823DFAA